MQELFLTLMRLVIPEPGADPVKDYRWRLTIAGLVLTNSFGTVLAVLLALGAIPVVSHGFASADAMVVVQKQWAETQQKNQQQFDALQTSQLDTKIMDTLTRQCGAIKAKSMGNTDPNLDSVVRFMTERLNEELDTFYNLAGHQYRLPGCEEL